MSDFKQCSKCDNFMNSLDDHVDCYRHRLCHVDFPCEVCKVWSVEKRNKIDKMIEKNLKKNTMTTTSATNESSSSGDTTSSQNPLSGNTGTTEDLSSQSPLSGNTRTVDASPTPSSLSGNTGPGQSPGMFQFPMINTQGNPFMWMNSMLNPCLNMGDSLQELIDKRVQEILGAGKVSNESVSVPRTEIVTSSSSVASVVTDTVKSTFSSQNVVPTLSTVNKRFNRLAPSSQYEDISDNETDEEDQVSLRAGGSENISEQGQDDSSLHELASQAPDADQIDSFSDFDSNNNLQWSGFMSKVASALHIDTIDSSRSEKDSFTSYVPEHVSNKSKSTSSRVRLPLDGMVLESLHNADKEFQAKGSVKAYKARDEEKFQIYGDHYEKYCTVPTLDDNVEEGLASSSNPSSFKKPFSKKHGFKFKDKTLLAHNFEMKRVDVQARLLLREINYGTLITSYLSQLDREEDCTEALKALYLIFSAMADVASRLSVNAVNSRRNAHLQEMAFKNKSTENKLRKLSTLGPKLFGGKYFDILHDSADNIRDARETQHLRKTFKAPDSSENKSGQNKRKHTDSGLSSNVNKDHDFKSKKFKSNKNKDDRHDRSGNSDFNKQNVSAGSSKKGTPQLGFRTQK